MTDKRQVKGKRKRKIRKESQFSRVTFHQIKKPGRIESGPRPACARLDTWAGILEGPLPSSVLQVRVMFTRKGRRTISTQVYTLLPSTPSGHFSCGSSQDPGLFLVLLVTPRPYQSRWSVQCGKATVYLLNMMMIKALAKKTSGGDESFVPAGQRRLKGRQYPSATFHNSFLVLTTNPIKRSFLT